jgi:hypothetical protein
VRDREDGPEVDNLAKRKLLDESNVVLEDGAAAEVKLAL